MPKGLGKSYNSGLFAIAHMAYHWNIRIGTILDGNRARGHLVPGPETSSKNVREQVQGSNQA